MIFKNDEEKLKTRSKIEDADFFWDIEDITPSFSEKNVNVTTITRKNDEPVVIKGAGNIANPSERISDNKSGEHDIIFSYSPENPLIEEVKVYNWHSKYTFYERFRIDAERYYDFKGVECQPVKYFSYMPGYMQMSSKQREWYFYWRDCVRNGRYIPTDSSYVLLYIYEIINLPIRVPAKEGLELLCRIWENYRASYTKLDNYMAEWVCDYCLINNLSLPFERIAVFLDKAAMAASLSQFYIQCDEDNMYACILMEKYSSYRWRQGKYIDSENRQLFEEHIKKGFVYGVARMSESDGRFDGKSGRLVKKNTVRDAFGGALCAYAIKKRLSVDYYTIENVRDIGFIVTDMVRYCENRVRAYLGIRPRLSIQNLTEYQKKILDEYFDKWLPVAEIKRKSRGYEEETEPNRPFKVSFERARQIEESSWEVTERLVEETDEDFLDTDETEAKKEETSIESKTLDVAKEALVCIAKGDKKGFEALADECYMMPETLAECVNELCYEIVGDIGIEERNGGYMIISDYRQEILQWLRI